MKRQSSIEFFSFLIHLGVNFRESIGSYFRDNLVYRVLYPEVLNGYGVSRERQCGTGRPWVAVEHSAYRTRVDEMDICNCLMIGRMGVTCNHNLAIGHRGQFIKPGVRCVGKEEFVVIGRAAVENTQSLLAFFAPLAMGGELECSFFFEAREDIGDWLY